MSRKRAPEGRWLGNRPIKAGHDYQYIHPSHGEITVSILSVDKDGPGVVTQFQYDNGQN